MRPFWSSTRCVTSSCSRAAASRYSSLLGVSLPGIQSRHGDAALGTAARFYSTAPVKGGRSNLTSHSLRYSPQVDRVRACEKYENKDAPCLRTYLRKLRRRAGMAASRRYAVTTMCAWILAAESFRRPDELVDCASSALRDSTRASRGRAGTHAADVCAASRRVFTNLGRCSRSEGAPRGNS